MLRVKLIEPPYTEPYVRWCERSEFLIQEKFLLLDLESVSAAEGLCFAEYLCFAEGLCYCRRSVFCRSLVFDDVFRRLGVEPILGLMMPNFMSHFIGFFGIWVFQVISV